MKASALEKEKPNPSVVSAEVLKSVQGETSKKSRDLLAREEPLEIRVRGRSIAVTMRTPGYDSELAAGFLLSEGMIQNRGQIVEIAYCRGSTVPDNTLNIFLAADVAVDLDALTRHVFASSSCGLCGKASIESVHQHFPPVDSAVTVPSEMLIELPLRLMAAQKTFGQSRGLHAAAIFDADGQLIIAREDVGRHNAVDKVLGYGLLENKLPFGAHILIVSGRASFEIMQKALAARVPIVCAISAPSSLAVEFARESS